MRAGYEVENFLHWLYTASKADSENMYACHMHMLTFGLSLGGNAITAVPTTAAPTTTPKPAATDAPSDLNVKAECAKAKEYVCLHGLLSFFPFSHPLPARARA